MSLEKAKETIRIEAAAVAALESRINGEFEKAVNLILRSTGKVIVCGMGKSGIIAKKIVATLTSTGTPAVFLHPAEGIHGDLGVVCRNDVVIVVSKSGETPEILDLFPTFERVAVKVIVMTGNVKSQLTRRGDVVIDVSVAKEACPYDIAPTASTTAALAMGDALAMALLEERNFKPDNFALLHPGGNLGKKLWLKVEDVMLTGSYFPSVHWNSSMKEAVLEMTSKRGCTSVVDDSGRLVGVITDGDLRRLLESRENIFRLKAKDAMTPKPKTVSKDELASQAARMMAEYRITSLIVTDKDNRPFGIAHLHDIMQAGAV